MAKFLTITECIAIMKNRAYLKEAYAQPKDSVCLIWRIVCLCRYNRIERRRAIVGADASQQPINKLTEQLRQECAQAGYTEGLTFTLVSHDTYIISMTHCSGPCRTGDRGFESCGVYDLFVDT